MQTFINNASIPLVIVLLIAGFALLIKGADFFVEGSSSVAKRFNVPSIIIGLTIVAMGTSLPETSVSVTASLTNQNTLAVSNAVGSNIFNLMVVIGVCAILTSVKVSSETIKRDIPFSALCAILLLALGVLSSNSLMILSRADGIIMLMLFVFYIIKLTKVAMKAGEESTTESKTKNNISLFLSFIFIIGGLGAIILGGDLTVLTASRLARVCGMSETLIGLTIVAIGTSLPELVTSIVAAKKNEIGMALGNAIGSNIFNILVVLGISSSISPVTLITENIIDIVVLLVFTLIVWLFAVTKKELSKKEGFMMLLMYLAYTVYIIIR